MTVSSDLYIQNITNSAGTASNPEFAITFPVYNEDDIWVWTKDVATGVLTKQVRGTNYKVKIDGTTGTLVWIGTTPAYTTATIRIQRHMERVQQDEYRDHRLGTTNNAMQSSLDKVSMMGQQSLEVDPLEQRHWTANGDRVGNIKDSASNDDAVSKSQVDTLVGGGTNPFTVSAGDVGKYRKYTGTGSAPTGSWQTLTGMADPKGKEFLYYTAAGWVDIAGNLPTIAGSADNGKVLMDISGTPTWITPKQVPVTFADSPSVTVGRPYSIVTHSSERVETVREYTAVPELLPNKPSQRLVSKETGFSTANNKMEFGRLFKITKHTVTCSKRTGTTDHTGIDGVSQGGSNGTITFSGTQTAGQTITIIDTKGTSKAYLAASAQNLTTDPPQFDCDGSAAAGATSLKACIESAKGHNGTIIVSDNLAGVLTLTQAHSGSGGNTTITENCDNVAKVDFANGGNDTVDHPVYIGQIDNIAEDDDVTLFLTSYDHEIPDDGSDIGFTPTRWWGGPSYNGSNPLTGIMSYSASQSVPHFSFIMNIYEQTDSLIKFSAASTLHESLYIYNRMTEWEGLPIEDYPVTDPTILRNMKHPDTLDITFNALWYLQRT